MSSRSLEFKAQRILGEIVGGTQGQQLLDESAGWMCQEKVKNPAAMAELYAPGFTK